MKENLFRVSKASYAGWKMKIEKHDQKIVEVVC